VDVKIEGDNKWITFNLKCK